MRKYLSIIAAALVIASCGGNQRKAVDPLADSGRTQRTENLLSNLKAWGDSTVYLFGHQDDTIFGIGWDDEQNVYILAHERDQILNEGLFEGLRIRGERIQRQLFARLRVIADAEIAVLAAFAAGIYARPEAEADHAAVGPHASDRSRGGEHLVQIRSRLMDVNEIIGGALEKMVPSALVSGPGNIGLLEQIQLLVDLFGDLRSLVDAHSRRDIGEHQNDGAVRPVVALLCFLRVDDHAVAELGALFFGRSSVDGSRAVRIGRRGVAGAVGRGGLLAGRVLPRAGAERENHAKAKQRAKDLFHVIPLFQSVSRGISRARAEFV